ncbi:MAG: DUF4350 domain-containing protein [Xenococcaceae cyanobacterium]
MKISKGRLWLFGAIALGAVIIITFLAAPANNKLNSGSTYSRGPDGYGAWYAFMSERGIPIQRWQKPFQDLVNREDVEPPITLLRVYSRLTPRRLSKSERDWVERGNNLVILGVREPVTEAPFSTQQDSPAGRVKIDTGRRKIYVKEEILGDRFGAVVWEEKLGKGRVIFATTPHLAANAYQDIQDNYKFLAQLVTKYELPVWVDEYIHGYKDVEVIARETGENLFSYLATKPIFLALVQGLILLFVAIWAGNRRFGAPITLSAPVIDNSKAYIQALAGVLQKAGSTEFVLDTVGKEEQRQLQKALGLGEVLLNHKSLVDAWVQQTGRAASELEPLLKAQSRKRRMREIDLLGWLDKWEQIRRQGGDW